MKRIFFYSTALLLLFVACSKDKQTLTDNTWQVESLKVHADSAWQDPFVSESGEKEPLTLSFRNKYNYSVTFRLAGCGGKVKYRPKHGIIFESGGCTTIGGDSQLAWNFYEILVAQINHYALNDNKLTLTGDNGETINLIKQ